MVAFTLDRSTLLVKSPWDTSRKSLNAKDVKR